MKPLRPCPGCLLADLDEKELLNTLREYIAQMDADEKVNAAAYRARLDACRVCPHLRSGLCGKCGCYVEFRAAKALMHCPDVPARWTAAPSESETETLSDPR